MTRDELIRMAQEAGAMFDHMTWVERDLEPVFERFFHAAYAAGAAAERNKVAQWIMARGYSTGHGDTVEDLLKELELTVREQERELCAQLCEEIKGVKLQGYEFAKAIRGEK